MEINGIKVIQVPFTIYARKNPIYVYCQLYNLVLNDGGQTSFTTEYRLTPLGAEEKDGVILDKIDRTGNEELYGEFAMLDVSKVDPGKYRLTVRTKDRYRVQTTERSRVIELVGD